MNNVVKNLGTIDMSSIEVTGAQIEVAIYLDDISPELDTIIENCMNQYRKDHPEVSNVAFCVKFVLSTGYVNPEFEFHIELFEEETMAHWDESSVLENIELSEEQKKQIKKAVCDHLTKILLDL